MVRETSDPAKVKKIKQMDVKIVYGDLRYSTTVDVSLQDVDTVISTCSSMPFSYVPGENDIQKVDRDGMINFIDQAEVSGVKHFIYISFSG